MTVAILDTPAAMEALAPAWHALWQRVGTTPFQSPHWLLPWWRAFGTGAPRVATWWDGDGLRGVLPAYVLRDAEGAKLLPVGAGTTDYLDVLGEGGQPMLDALLGRAATEGVARADLIELPQGSQLRDAVPPAGWRAVLHGGEACPVLRIGDTPTGMLRKLRMNRNRAERAGGWAVRHATVDTLEADLACLVLLHGARWATAGEPGVLLDPAVLRFHRDATPGLLRAGLLRLATLHVGGSAAAAILALLGPRATFFYLQGYDPAHAFVSPGTVLLGAMLDEAAGEGRTEAHFLRGQEGYKYAWGAVDRFNATLSLVRA